jgi:predicted O-linked N-acetylglucosamine transferase (SPINDLY family)
VGRFLLPLLENHNHRDFEIIAYCNAPDQVADEMTGRLRDLADVWRNISGVTDEAAVDRIRQDRIDILVDLTLHMANNRLPLFARKPAPIQVTYLAYAGSSGLSAMDYRLSDPYLDPPGEDESIYSEKTVRLPETYWCYSPPIDLPIASPPVLENGFITFGSLNSFSKVNEPLLVLWARALNAVPKSRLILHAMEGAHRQRVLNHLQENGVENSRITFAGKMQTSEYFASYQSIDIALDTTPYGGGTTTCDALWMGVPVVSIVGRTAVGRGGLSILSNLGLRELVARTSDEYVQISAGLANNVPQLGELRATLRDRMKSSPLMDAPKFARDIEAAFRQMWQTWCEAESKDA